MSNSEQSRDSFYGLGIATRMLEELERAKFTVPTPIQKQSIPIAIEGKDIIGVAQTGTGKTLAFGVPLLQRLALVKGRGLIILPTRELAIQVDEMLHKIGKFFGLRTTVIIGGASMVMQKKSLARNPHIIISTPGRLIDHLDQKTLKLDNVKILILDEADRMFDMGFAPQISRILQSTPKDRQTMLFSATMPDQIVRLASSHMKLPVRVEIARPGTVASRVTHEMFVVKSGDKIRLLEKLLKQYRGTVLVFSRTKYGAKRINRDIRNMGASAVEIHSDRTLSQRREAITGFKMGKYRVLVATDIAARGIDVTGIELVVNFDLPENPEDYVHRVGRTGRAGETGHAISFAMPEQRRGVREIEQLIRTMIPISKLPELPASRQQQNESIESTERPPFKKYQSSGFGGNRRSSSFSDKHRHGSFGSKRRSGSFGGKRSGSGHSSGRSWR